MRSWLIAAMSVLAIAVMTPGGASAAPAGGQTAIDRATVGSPTLEDVRYRVHCHHARVWRDTPYGRRLVRVRRCHRVYY